MRGVIVWGLDVKRKIPTAEPPPLGRPISWVHIPGPLLTGFHLLHILGYSRDGLRTRSPAIYVGDADEATGTTGIRGEDIFKCVFLRPVAPCLVLLAMALTS